jgi:N-acyl-phosphatidylethanolamine-hydrolysing phospholipase D
MPMAVRLRNAGEDVRTVGPRNAVAPAGRRGWRRALGVVALCGVLEACFHSGKPQRDAWHETQLTGTAAGAPNTAEALPRVVPVAAGDGIFWLGHSSFLVRRGRKALVTDPVFSDSPDIRYGLRLRRMVGPPPGLDRMTDVAVVVISHTHADHFDLETLRALASRFPAAELVVPAGRERTAARAGFDRVRGVAPWQTISAGGFHLTGLPARHVGRRFLGLVNPSLALSWQIDGAGPRIFFSGDTAYGPHFEDIRKRRGRFDVALVAVGGYTPELILNRAHQNPEQAVQAAADLGASIAIGHHWGTFTIAVESADEVRTRFMAAARPGVRTVLLEVGGRHPLR